MNAFKSPFKMHTLTITALLVLSHALVGGFVQAQSLKTSAQLSNKPKPQKETAASALAASTTISGMDDPCKKLAGELSKLKLEAAGKVKETERVRLLDPDLGAMQQTALAEVNTKIKNAELALARCEEKDREKKAAEQLKQQQEHELKLEQVRHENNKELTRMQIQASQAATQPLPAEKDFFEMLGDSLDAQATLQQGVEQIGSTDKATQADGFRKVSSSLKQVTPK